VNYNLEVCRKPLMTKEEWFEVLKPSKRTPYVEGDE